MILITTGNSATVTIVGLRDQDNNDVVLTHPETKNLLDNYDQEDINNVLSSIQSQIDAGNITATEQDGDIIANVVNAPKDVTDLADIAFNGQYSSLENVPTNIAKKDEINVFSERQQINVSTGNASLAIDSDDSDSLITFRSENHLWSIGSPGFINSDEFRITKTNGLGSNVSLSLEDFSLDIFNKRINNVIDPFSPQDAATKAYVDAQLGTLATEAYTIFPIWAEENGGIGNGSYEWSWGNGATGAPLGIVVPINCEIFAVTINAEVSGTSVSIDTQIDGSTVETSLFTSNNSVVNLTTPVALSASQRVGFRTNTVSGTWSDVRVCAWLRVKSSGMPDTLFTPNGQDAITVSDLNRNIQLNGYGQGNNTGTEAFGLAVDSTGRIIERQINSPDTDFTAISNQAFTSTSFANIPGLTDTVTLNSVGTVSGRFSYSVVRSGTTNAICQFRVVVAGDNGPIFVDTVSSFNDVGKIAHGVGSLAAGTYTVTIQAQVNQPITITAATLEADAVED